MTTQNQQHSIFIGIDPGTRVTGYAILRVEGNEYKPLDYGCIKPPPILPLADRYLIIFNSVAELVERHKPHAVIVETQYVHKNVQSAIKLGMARGCIIIAARQRDVPIVEYSPSEAKLAVVGNGRASKKQVQGMVQRLLCLSKIPEPEDAADALALTICHAHAIRYKKIRGE